MFCAVTCVTCSHNTNQKDLRHNRKHTLLHTSLLLLVDSFRWINGGNTWSCSWIRFAHIAVAIDFGEEEDIQTFPPSSMWIHTGYRRRTIMSLEKIQQIKTSSTLISSGEVGAPRRSTRPSSRLSMLMWLRETRVEKDNIKLNNVPFIWYKKDQTSSSD